MVGLERRRSDEEKMALRERLTEASSDGKVTMVEWNKAWQKFTRSRDVYQTLSNIESTGNERSTIPSM